MPPCCDRSSDNTYRVQSDSRLISAQKQSMNHPSFAYEHSLPSLRLTKDFLESLERYIIKRAGDLTVMNPEEIKACLRIKIDDRFGSENLNSIARLDSSRFEDSTSRVELELDTPYRSDGIKLRVRLNFSKGRLFSTVSIAATMPNARDVSLSLKDGILRMLDPQRTWHWVCHPIASVWGIIFGVGAMSMYSLYQSESNGFVKPMALGLSILLWFYLFYIGTLRTYTVFDSRASERADKIWSWLIGGIGTFLIFGTLLTLLRRQILGF